MWLAFAAGSALFSGLTAILAKCGIRQTDSTVATAIRTIVVLACSWLMVLVVGSAGQMTHLDPKTWLFLVLSGLATGASWLCYFRALQLGSVNHVTPIDKSSTVMTMVLAAVLLGEPFGPAQLAATVLIGVGTVAMIQPSGEGRGQALGEGTAGTGERPGWLMYALLSAVFAALTAILGKVGMQGVESNLGTAIRTVVVLVMAWLMVAITGKTSQVRAVPRRELTFICLSGVATGAAWLCYYRALQEGPASVVVPVDKLSILVTIAFSRIVFGERLTPRAALGLVLVVAGTLLVALA
ncbi:EamA family transporter [Collinsella sp. An2]|uniref:EamA family transporter n=1 Tax=Collinsella sp. An2 TaxID=1965585 RepID=UPI000B38B97A|nr:EamA family transporter [Collinsella sp. An2]OUP11084.1 multidrug DMT transporter permease [Collinsella sp. An2]